MPRAEQYTRSDVEKRKPEGRVDPVLVETLVGKLPIPKSVQSDPAKAALWKEGFIYQLHQLLWHYRVSVLAHRQELPARMVASLNQGLVRGKKLRDWLNSVPDGLRFELRAGGLEGFLDDFAVLVDELVSHAEARSAYWQGHVEPNRPVGEGEMGRWLRQWLAEIIATHWPDSPDVTAKGKRVNDGKRRRWVADAARLIGARYPDEKKNPGRFAGTAPASLRRVGLAAKTRKRANVKTKEARARARRLADAAI